MPSATARGGDGRCLSKRAPRNPVRADGRLARQPGLAGSVAVVTHCGSVVPPGRRRGWPQRAGGRCLPSRCTPGCRPAGGRRQVHACLLYTSDAADEEDSVDLGGRRIIKKKKKKQ